MLRRIPVFNVIEDEVVEYPRRGGTLGFDRMPARFTPTTAPSAAAGD